MANIIMGIILVMGSATLLFPQMPWALTAILFALMLLGCIMVMIIDCQERSQGKF